MSNAYPPSPAASNPAVTAFDQIETLGYRGIAVFGVSENVKDAGRRPCGGDGWQGLSPEVNRQHLVSPAGRNVGILCAHGTDITAVDIDCDYPQIAAGFEAVPVLTCVP